MSAPALSTSALSGFHFQRILNSDIESKYVAVQAIQESTGDQAGEVI